MAEESVRSSAPSRTVTLPTDEIPTQSFAEEPTPTDDRTLAAPVVPHAFSHDVGAERYRFGAKIAVGGMGAVYAAIDTAFDREVAVKTLLDRYGAQSVAAKRFVIEARITGRLQHIGVPPVHDLGTLPDDPDRWKSLIATATAATRRAEQAINAGEPTDELKAMVASLVVRRDGADRDRRLFTQLNDVGIRIELERGRSLDAEYRKAFAEVGFDILTSDPKQAGELVAKHHQAPIIRAALTDWAVITSDKSKRDRIRKVLFASASNVDRRTADALAAPGNVIILRRLAADPTVTDLPPRQLEILAACLKCEGSYGDAIGLLFRAIDRYPTDVRLKICLIPPNLNMMTPGYAQMVARHLTAAVALAPSCGKLWNASGVVLMVAGENEGALRCFKKAVELDPDNADGHNSLGLLSERYQSDPKAAVLHFRKATELDPDKAVCWCNLGNALGRVNDHPGALAAYARAMKADPDHVSTYVSLSGEHLQNKELDDAIKMARKAIELDPKSAYAYYNLGMAQMGKGNVIDGLSNIRKATEVDPLFQKPAAGKAPKK